MAIQVLLDNCNQLQRLKLLVLNTTVAVMVVGHSSVFSSSHILASSARPVHLCLVSLLAYIRRICSSSEEASHLVRLCSTEKQLHRCPLPQYKSTVPSTRSISNIKHQTKTWRQGVCHAHPNPIERHFKPADRCSLSLLDKNEQKIDCCWCPHDSRTSSSSNVPWKTLSFTLMS